MKLALENPSTILVVASEGGRDALVDATARDGVDVAVVESLAAARGRIDGDEVACIVIGDVDGDVAGFVSEMERDIPVLYVPSSADDEVVAAVTAAGARYLPRVDGLEDRLVDATDGAVERYQERWTHAKDSSILDTMLSELDVPLFAKDERARHVKVADVQGGHSPEEQYGKTDLEVFSGDESFNAEETYRDDRQVIERGEPVRRKLIQHGEQAPFWQQVTKVPWHDEDGDVVGLVGIAIDATPMREQIRQLQEQVERLEDFASHVHHDLKNPLQVASGHLELARQRDDDGPHLEKVEGALDRMAEMLDDLRELSHGGTVLDIEMGRTVLPRIVDDVWGTLETTGATLAVKFPETTKINAPESDVRPLFENLLKNAIEHGGVDVTVGPLPDGFYVADNGPGIPKGEREQVLEKGYTTSASGSGEGLAIVSEIALDNGWGVEVTESESGGARFEFRNVMIVTDPPETTAGGPSYELEAAADIGTVRAGERGTYDATIDRWTIEADGDNIWQDDNDFHFVYTQVSGDVRIQGRIRDVENVHQFSKGGFMLRDDVGEDSAYCHLGATALRGSEVLWRERHGSRGWSQLLGDETDRFEYYRLERVGDTVTYSVSGTGEDWTAIDQRQVEFDDPILAGIAVCSVSPRYPTTVVAEDVSVTSLAVRSDE